MRKAGLLIFFLILAVSVFAEDAGRKVFKAVIDERGVQKADIIGGEYFFDPNYIIVKANVPVELTIKKTTGYVPHNIIIKGLDTLTEINANIDKEPKVLKFTPRKIGKYPFYCDKKLLFFKSHQERGMEGIIEVIE
ncbi:MAG: cupredoxin domain-containing protein [Nitrospirae bacterium]|nr:cupredoxin domain-containing protein [Nitrospirota bacterium]MBI4839017.1 cupredoxin domain-containing protein [Nitrospirota bacterium]